MRSFFFHVHAICFECRDFDGASFETLDGALKYATGLAAELASDSQFDMGSVEVMDEQGGQLGHVPIISLKGTRP
jgi:hypothetical protein